MACSSPQASPGAQQALRTVTGTMAILQHIAKGGWTRGTIWLLACLAVAMLAGTVAAQPRLALVIGNAAYSKELGPLHNPAHDATDMDIALRKLGFTVTLVHNATHQRMGEAVAAFSRQLRASSVGLFYFAGHGAQVNGRNYLIPIGARIDTEAALPFQAMAAEEVLAHMEAAGAGETTTIIILDACRNAPFKRAWRSGSNGLAPMEGTRGSFIAFATAPGSVAADGTDRNGVYTKHLLRFIHEPNLLVDRMFRQVLVAVEAETHRRQIPWIASSLRQDFYFNPGTSGVPNAPGVETPQPQGHPITAMGHDGAAMVLVPAGEFLMGTSPEEVQHLLQIWPRAQREWFENELPQRRVSLDAFYIDKYEVTNARFQQFVRATGHRTQAEQQGWSFVNVGGQWDKITGATWQAPQGPGSTVAGLAQHPVVQVSQEDAKAYCAWAGKRLPTEAEWEKAARGTDGRHYPWGQAFDGKRANFCDTQCPFKWRDTTVDDGYHTTAPVGSSEGAKSPYGAYDMAGNVWEWVADWYEASYYRHSPTRNPPGPSSGHNAVLRGGGWVTVALFVRTSFRSWIPPTNRDANVGFRCARAA